jgi:hypothetical protein
MATQTVEFIAPTGQTISAKIFASGSDTIVQSVTATEQTNRKGVYQVAYIDAPSNTYRLIAFVGTLPVAAWWTTLTLTDGTFQAYEMPSSGGTGDASQTTLLAVKAKTDLIVAGLVQFTNPVNSTGSIAKPIFRGDDYKASIGNAFVWNITARTGYVVATSTCRFGGSSATTGNTWNVAGTVSDNGDGTWKLSFDMNKTITAALGVGFYQWTVELINAGGDEVTEVYNATTNGAAEVKNKQT